MTTQEEAKFWSDKRKLENHPGINKTTAVGGLGVSPENFDKINGQPEDEKALQDFFDCFIKIKEAIKYYVDMPDNNVHIVALWVLGTYLHSGFSAFPYLFLNAMRGSAKTRTLGIIANLAHKGQGRVHVGVNERVLYRSEEGATLILDECEQIGKKQKEELREYLNAGYKRGTTVSRSKKVKIKNKDMDEEKFVQEEFKPYRPIALANIWGMEEVLGDRCITLILEKSNKPEYIKIIEDFTENPIFSEISNKLKCSLCSLCSKIAKSNYVYFWNQYVKITTPTTSSPLTTLTALTTLPEDFPEHLLPIFDRIYNSGIDGRNLELFLPILITSLLLGEDIFVETLKIASETVKNRKTEELAESKDVSFIEFISTLTQYAINYVSLREITRRYKEYLGEVDDEDRWLNEKWTGRAIKRLNLSTAKRRVAHGTEVILNIAHAQRKLNVFKIDEKNEI